MKVTMGRNKDKDSEDDERMKEKVEKMPVEGGEREISRGGRIERDDDDDGEEER